MDRSDDRTAELRRAPQAVPEHVPPPRPRAGQSASGRDPYPAAQQPRSIPRIQYTPRIQNSPQPTFSPARPVPRSASPQPTSPRPPSLPPRPLPPRPLPARQSSRRYERRPARAVIGDELRIPILWCQFGRCVAYYTDVDALGERDLRFRALVAGWRYDLLGRLACPWCVQHDPAFWITRPPALVRQR